MNITIIGYGRMGKEVEQIAEKRGHTIVSTVDPVQGLFSELSDEAVKDTQGVIEFGLPEGILDRISFLSSRNIPVVIGTTGWQEQEAKAEEIVKSTGGALLYGSNFSPGANLFFRIVEEAAGLINSLDDYDIMMHEYHHKKKKDSPSGTALTLAGKILENLERKKSICFDPLQREIRDDELHIGTVRGGHIPGIHRVTMDSPADSIVLEHSARNRSGFASGSVIGLEWLMEKRGMHHADSFFRDLMES
ncbi:4-hydroxy-tetrahydrodipicolinate reductase [Salinispira pacifica]|uniref:4-hydroxy-tetrahydrodipicolinate reductase n=1 Tax=Salinispira pacifica TaxID=1307761 RepID=V5WG66_9SPIO|nr:4-hydroxy-tetrahydrodipicolinate reductase [Salinispira pacifica]AHC14529.1 Dihydrodipicolinate reductase [Salinispira pacifica]